uniref:Uncharacterized protein n=2 Tax=Lepeophtheirus salmonis TaxID=72036 RepID=A0A0K2UJP0_LEPSM
MWSRGMIASLISIPIHNIGLSIRAHIFIRSLHHNDFSVSNKFGCSLCLLFDSIF